MKSAVIDQRVVSADQRATQSFRRLLRADRLLFEMSETLRAAGRGEWACGLDIERVRLAGQLEELQTAAYRGWRVGSNSTPATRPVLQKEKQ